MGYFGLHLIHLRGSPLPVHGLPQVVDAFQVRKDLPGVGEEVGEDVVGVPRALQHV